MIEDYIWVRDTDTHHILKKKSGDETSCMEFPKTLFEFDDYEIGDIFGIDYCSGSTKIFRLLMPQPKERQEK